ncbi:acyl-CoA synthetase [Methylobrevis pamukkalensis]|uniref:Acyl-CoA synthetase n=2 Tax=Methylobrevis pamukkalensis TaxID=1439726 RepID=A0A1E3H3D3_9HYPH|nr:acyl-CoA synthetase [Methylobrevis pamukkalensis]
MRAGDRRPSATSGEIVLSGAIVPDAPWPETAAGGSGRVLAVNAEGLLRTGLYGTLMADGSGIRPAGTVSETVTVAGEIFDLAALDALFARIPGVADAAAFVVADELLGSRIGLSFVPDGSLDVTAASVAAFLAGEGVGILERPAMLVPVDSLRRGQDGRVLRPIETKTSAAA